MNPEVKAAIEDTTWPVHYSMRRKILSMATTSEEIAKQRGEKIAYNGYMGIWRDAQGDW